jgi:subtilisin family serine protease
MTLEPALVHALAVWQTELGVAADTDEYRDEYRREELAGRRVTVHVRYTGDVIEALRDAGMETGFDSGGLISGNIAMADVERLGTVPGVELVQMEHRAKPILDDSVKEIRVPWKVMPPPEPSPWPGRGAGVIVAVIDTGIDIFHESFRKADTKTRILALWDQSATTGGSPPPTGFTQSLGRVYSENDINTALAAGPPFVSVDKDGHGTHVAGIAAGDGSQKDRCHGAGRYVGVAPEADLVIVKAIGDDVKQANIREALNWCALMGTQRTRPVVINCSFGVDAGHPHDGTYVHDTAVDELLHPPGGTVRQGLAVVAGAGNAGDVEVHEEGVLPPGASVTVPFRVPPGSVKVDEIDVWYNGTASLNVEVVAPANPSRPGPVTTGAVPPGTFGQAFPIGLMTLTISSSNAPQPHHNNKKQINVTVTTPSMNPPPPPAPQPEKTAVRAGDWQLKLQNTSGVAAVWDAWLEYQRGDAFPTFRMENEPQPVTRRRAHTIASPGTSLSAITVANHDRNELYRSSSRGPIHLPGGPAGQRKPTLAAPGATIAAPRSRDDKNKNSSCCDQLVLDKTGTSMAAPHVAGVVALMFQKNRTLTFEQVRATLQKFGRTEGIPQSEMPSVPDDPPQTGIRTNNLWGSGKLDAALALANILPGPTVAVAGASGRGGAPRLAYAPEQLGLTPHTLVSRLGDWQRRFGARPGVNLFAALVSEHVDEVLRLVNENRRVTVAWRRLGGPALVRYLLHGPPPGDPLLPRRIDGCDVAELLGGFVTVLDQFGGPRLRADVVRYADFVKAWPGGSLARLDQVALALGTR